MNFDVIYSYAFVFVVLWVPVMAVWLGGIFVGRQEERRRWEQLTR